MTNHTSVLLNKTKLSPNLINIINEFLVWVPTPSASCIKKLKRNDTGCCWTEGEGGQVDQIVFPTFFDIKELNYQDSVWSRPRWRTTDFGWHPCADLIEQKWLDDSRDLRRRDIYDGTKWSEGWGLVPAKEEFTRGYWGQVPWPLSIWIRDNRDKALESSN